MTSYLVRLLAIFALFVKSLSLHTTKLLVNMIFSCNNLLVFFRFPKLSFSSAPNYFNVLVLLLICLPDTAAELHQVLLVQV